MTNDRLPSESELRRVALDNIRDHQLGGLTDGVSQEIAEEMGFTTDPNDIKGILEKREHPASAFELNKYWPGETQRRAAEIGLRAVRETLDQHRPSK